MSGGTIFISYRRGPDENAAGRLYEALADRVGGGRIFMDVDGIRPGTDFVDDLNNKLDDCKAFLAIIGPGWVDRQGELTDPQDFVRREYSAVLGRSDIPFIPLFFNGAQMPAEADLPEDLKGLVRRNGISMPHEHFSSVLKGRLLPELSKILGEDLTRQETKESPKPRSRKLLTAVLGLAVAGVVAIAGLTLATGGTGWMKAGTALFLPNVLGDVVLEISSDRSGFSRIAFSPDGDMVASGDSNLAAKIWDTRTGELISQFHGHTARVEMVTFSDDGHLLATVGRDRTVRVWDVATQDELAVLTGHDDWVYSVDFSSDGTKLLTASGDGTVKLWTWGSAEEPLTFVGHQGEVRMAVFSPKDATIASASVDGTAKIWNATTGEIVHDLTTHRDALWAVAFSPDGTALATASEDETASLWDTFSGSEVLFLDDHDDAVTGIAFSHDGQRIATSSSDGTSRIWDAATGEQLGMLFRDEAEFFTVALSSDGRLFATATLERLILSQVE